MKSKKLLNALFIFLGLSIGGFIIVFTADMSTPIDSPAGKFLMFEAIAAVIELIVAAVLFMLYFKAKAAEKMYYLDGINLRKGICPNCKTAISNDCKVCPNCKTVIE